MTHKPVAVLIRYWPVRFLIDFWLDDPVRALRHYTRRRTWPSPKEFAAMGEDEFFAWLDRHGLLA